MVYPSLVGVEKIKVTVSASGVAAGGSAVVTASVGDGIILGVPILVSKGTYVGDVRILYGVDGGFVVELTNSDTANAQDLSAIFEVFVMPNV